MSNKTAFLAIPGHILANMSSGFPSDVQLLGLSAAFYLAKLFYYNYYMLLSGTSVNHRLEAEQS